MSATNVTWKRHILLHLTPAIRRHTKNEYKTLGAIGRAPAPAPAGALPSGWSSSGSTSGALENALRGARSRRRSPKKSYLRLLPLYFHWAAATRCWEGAGLGGSNTGCDLWVAPGRGGRRVGSGAVRRMDKRRGEKKKKKERKRKNKKR